MFRDVKGVDVKFGYSNKIELGNNNRTKKTYFYFTIFFVALICLTIIFIASLKDNAKKTYTAYDFGIETLKSAVDFNNNGIDDYTDILLGARADAQNLPVYQDTYWGGGYPPDDIGVCTDLVWRAFKNAGYCLKCMIDLDISQNISDYPRVENFHDPNIDFRRVPNMKVFFDKYAISLTIDTDDISKWQPGDIVIYGNYHIGIISDKRNRYGIPYLIHNSGQPQREEDTLANPDITGHYRFDASKVDEFLLIPFP